LIFVKDKSDRQSLSQHRQTQAYGANKVKIEK